MLFFMILCTLLTLSMVVNANEDLIITARQKRKLDEMYDQVRNEIESLKRSAIQPANNFFSRTEPDLFADPTRRLDSRDPIRTGSHFQYKR